MLLAILIWSMFGLICVLFIDHINEIVIREGNFTVKFSLFKKICGLSAGILFGPFAFIFFFMMFRSSSELCKQVRKDSAKDIIDKFSQRHIINYVGNLSVIENRSEIENKIELELSKFPKFW